MLLLVVRLHKVGMKSTRVVLYFIIGSVLPRSSFFLEEVCVWGGGKGGSVA